MRMACQVETIRANIIGCLNLADVCLQREIHMLYYGTGCIFHYDDEHLIGGQGFSEDDKPNFTGSYYSHSKVGIPCRLCLSRIYLLDPTRSHLQHLPKSCGAIPHCLPAMSTSF